MTLDTSTGVVTLDNAADFETQPSYSFNSMMESQQ